MYSCSISRAIIVADDRLCRLGDRVRDHEHDRQIVAGHAVCCYAILFQHPDKSIVADQHHAGDRQFAQHRRGSQLDHIPRVPTGQVEAFHTYL